MSATATTATLHRLVLLLRQSETPDGEHLADVAMDEVARTLGAVATCVYRLRRGKLSVVGSGAAARDEELTGGVARLATSDDGIVARCAAGGATRFVDRAAMSEAEADERAILERTGAERLHALPLRASSDLVGVLLYASACPAGPLEEGGRREELEIVSALLGLVLAAMARRAIQTEAELVATMHRVVSTLLDQVAYEPPRRICFGDVPSFDDRTFLKILLDGAAVVTNAEIGALGVGTDPERPFEPFLATGIPPAVAKAIGKHPRPIGTLGAVAIQGKTVRVPEIGEHAAFVGLPAHHPPVHSLLAIPIRIRDRSFGNLYLANKRNRKEFSETDEQVVELLAALAAMGMHFARFAVNELERETIQQILEAAPDGLLYIDKLTGNILVSRSFERFYGHPFSPSAGLEQELGMLCTPDGQCLSWDELPSTRALRGEASEDVELLIVRPDGSRLPISERAVPFIRNGVIHGALICARDLSLAKEAERVREEFAAMVVHDLRNPIQSMLLQIRALRTASEAGRPLASASWDRLVRSATRLARMASDMLDSTRIELSRVALDRVPTDPLVAVRNVVEGARTIFTDHPLVVDVLAHPLPHAMIDAVRFEQILTNLLENAAKASAEGTSIHVELRPVGSGIEIAVRDQGVGISPEELPKLFDRFYQARRAREQRLGLGLGLHIARGLAEAHGGHITAESVIDRGSVFRVWLPAFDAAPATTAMY